MVFQIGKTTYGNPKIILGNEKDFYADGRVNRYKTVELGLDRAKLVLANIENLKNFVNAVEQTKQHQEVKAEKSEAIRLELDKIKGLVARLETALK
jgi:alpha-D-ribose 1-methylphosphonate 5-triphosphate diphosphatase PhnM